MATTTIAPPGSCYRYQDWVCSNEGLCQGYYVEPAVPFPSTPQKNLENQPIVVTAEHGEFGLKGSGQAKGNVHIQQGNRQVIADQIYFHRNPNNTKEIDHIKAIGNVTITEPGLRLEGRDAEIDLQNDKEYIQDAHFRLYPRHARGTADSISVLSHNRMILKNATYSTCAPYENTWTLKASNLDLNKTKGRGRARHARLYVKDIPVFYFPYVDFPIDDRRKTGFLFPELGLTNRSGAEFAAPFYWNMAPNYDALITPRIYTKRGLETKGLFRYLTPNSSGEIEGSVLPNDNEYRRFLANERKILAGKKPNDPVLLDPRVVALNRANPTRRGFRAHHTTVFNPFWSAVVQYQNVADDDFFMDFGTNLGMASNNQLLQRGTLTYTDANWKVLSRVQQYQTLHPFFGPATQDEYKRLPQIAFDNIYTDLPCGLEWTSQGEFSHFLHKYDYFTGNPFTTGDRFQLRPGIGLPVITPGWFIKPRAQLNVLSYSLSLSPQAARMKLPMHPTRIIPMYDLDSGLIFERNLAFRGQPYIQTLEPRAYYLFVPFHDQNQLPIFDTTYPGFDYNQLFRDNRFTGLDRVGDANQLTLSVTTRFLNNEIDCEGDGEPLRLMLGQILYFKERRVFICNPLISPFCRDIEMPERRHHSSSWVAQGRLKLLETWTANAEIEWDPYKKRRDKEYFFLQFHPTPHTVFNIGYQFLRRSPVHVDPQTGLPSRVDQTDLSFAYALTEKWRLLARWHYDIKNHRSNDTAIGIEHLACCTAVRFYVSRYLEPYDPSRFASPIFNHNRYSNRFFLQFVFRGFAPIGHSQITSHLKRSIPGYEAAEN